MTIAISFLLILGLVLFLLLLNNYLPLLNVLVDQLGFNSLNFELWVSNYYVIILLLLIIVAIVIAVLFTIKTLAIEKVDKKHKKNHISKNTYDIEDFDPALFMSKYLNKEK